VARRIQKLLASAPKRENRHIDRLKKRKTAGNSRRKENHRSDEGKEGCSAENKKDPHSAAKERPGCY